MNELRCITNLVGNITREDLKYVDYYVWNDFGIFMPVVGYCKYAITENHTHPAYSFVIYFNEEDAIAPSNIKVNENEYLVQGMSPEFAHNENTDKDFTRYIAVFISKDFYEKEYKNYGDCPKVYKFNSFNINKNIMLYIERFISEYEGNILGRGKLLDLTSRIIIHELIRGVLHIDLSEKTSSYKSEIENVVNYMHQHFSEKITVLKLASMCNISQSSFTKLFKDEIHTSPMDYLIKIRIDKSKKLLRSNSRTITEISLECGFSSLSHFSSCFTKHMKISPREYEALYK